jgi:hypothetical protein
MNAPEACTLAADTIRDLAAARARVIDLKAERDSYREIGIVAIEEVATLTRQVTRQSEIIAAQRDELRRYTARAVREVAA